MLYAATKASMKKEFSSDVLIDDMTANSKVGITIIIDRVLFRNYFLG